MAEGPRSSKIEVELRRLWVPKSTVQQLLRARLLLQLLPVSEGLPLCAEVLQVITLLNPRDWAEPMAAARRRGLAPGRVFSLRVSRCGGRMPPLSRVQMLLPVLKHAGHMLAGRLQRVQGKQG